MTAQSGITGISQDHGRDELCMATKLRLDIYYLKHRSLVSDFWILGKIAGEISSSQGVS